MKQLIVLFLPFFLYAQSIELQILGLGGPEFSKGGKKIVFAGDTSAESEKLINLAHKVDYLVVHHAIAQHAGHYAKELHITPKRIGEVAAKAQVKNLVLSHRMKRTYSSEKKSLELIRKNYKGNIIWAEDLMKIKVQ